MRSASEGGKAERHEHVDRVLLEVASVGTLSRAQVPVTAAQVPNNLAAFEVSGAGVAHFNGVYKLSTMLNTQAACTSEVWELNNVNGMHYLYNMNGAWVMDLRGADPMYNGADDNSCAPDTASWASLVAAQGGTAPTVVRSAAASFNPPAATAAGSPAAATATSATYFVIAGAGILAFDGVYYETSLMVADERCRRTYAKGGPNNADYTLVFSDPNWILQSSLAGVTTKMYSGQDDGSCSPELVTWGATVGLPGGAAPSVALSATATTTFTTTTTTTTTITTTEKAVVTPAPTPKPKATNTTTENKSSRNSISWLGALLLLGFSLA